MICDQSSARILRDLQLSAGLSSDFPTNDWRQVIAADRTLAPIELQLHDILRGLTPAQELQIQFPIDPLTPVERSDWCGFVVNSLAHGLAYGPLSRTARVDEPRAKEINRWLGNAISTLRSPTFLANWDLQGTTWTPVSAHTFDACLLAYDTANIIVVLVVDED